MVLNNPEGLMCYKILPNCRPACKAVYIYISISIYIYIYIIFEGCSKSFKLHLDFRFVAEVSPMYRPHLHGN